MKSKDRNEHGKRHNLEIQYMKDSIARGEATFIILMTKTSITYRTAWKIEGGKLIEEVLESSKEKLLPVGKITVDEILHLDHEGNKIRGTTNVPFILEDKKWYVHFKKEMFKKITAKLEIVDNFNERAKRDHPDKHKLKEFLY